MINIGPELMKEIFIDAICGAGFNNIGSAMDMQNKGYAIFTGNQHNEDWAWDRKALNRLTTEVLVEIYVATKRNSEWGKTHKI